MAVFLTPVIKVTNQENVFKFIIHICFSAGSTSGAHRHLSLYGRRIFVRSTVCPACCIAVYANQTSTRPYVAAYRTHETCSSIYGHSNAQHCVSICRQVYTTDINDVSVDGKLQKNYLLYC